MNRRELHVYYALRRAWRRGLREEPAPVHHDVRDVLGELDAEPSMHQIVTEDQLDALHPDTIIRDADDCIAMRWPGAWMSVGSADPHKPQLPAFVIVEGAS